MNPAPNYHSDSNTTVFLLGAILNILACTEWASLADYAIKAIIGGIIWLGFKFISNYISKKNNDNNPQGPKHYDDRS